MASNLNKYALIDIRTFTEKAALVQGIYQYIIQKTWSVTSLSASQFIGVGLPGTPPTDDSNNFLYSLWVNGSTYIQDFCFLNDNVSIYKSLEIKEDLVVNGNTIFKNLLLNNVNVTNNVIVNSNLYVNNTTYLNTLNVSNADIKLLNSSILFSNNASMINASMNDVFINNASIVNASINTGFMNNLSINNASINTNFINNASINNASINTASINTLNSINGYISTLGSNSAIITNINVENTATINSLITPRINASSINISNAIINNASFNNTNLLKKTNIYANKLFNTQLDVYNTSMPSIIVPSRASYCDVFMRTATFIDTIFANKIYCDDIAKVNASITNLKNIGVLSVTAQPDENGIVQDGVVQFGQLFAPVNYESYSLGTIVHGEKKDNIDNTTTFDLNAISHPQFGYGIKYNGPVNIGNLSSQELNLTGKGNINLTGNIILNQGIVTISAPIISTTPPFYDVNRDALYVVGTTTINGILNVRELNIPNNLTVGGDLLLGGNITSYSDIKLKNNILKLTDCLNKIDNINGYSYTRNDLSDITKPYIGLIAQEVETIYPELITETNNIKSINYQSMIPILVECVKELKCEINKLKS